MPAYFEPLRRKIGLWGLIATVMHVRSLLVPIPHVNTPVFSARLASRRIATLADLTDTWKNCVLAMHTVVPQLIVIPLILLSAWLLLSKPRAKKPIAEFSSR